MLGWRMNSEWRFLVALTLFSLVGLSIPSRSSAEVMTQSEKNRQRWVVRSLYDQFPDEHIRGLSEYPRGVMWFGTWGEGLVRYDGRNRLQIKSSDGLPTDFIRRVSVAPDGRIWVAARGGAASLNEDGTGIEVFTEEDGLVSDDLFGLDIDSQGRVWVTGPGGVSRINVDGSIQQFGTDRPDLAKNCGRSVAVDEARGIVWVGWREGIVNAFDLETGEVSSVCQEMVACPDQNVNDLELDTQNNLWIACDWSTYRYDGESMEAIRPESMTGDWGSGGLCAGPDGTMWLGLQIGLALYDRGSLTFFDWRDGLLQDNVNDLHVSMDGTVWAGTTGGVSFLTPSQFIPMDAPKPHNFRFLSNLADSKGRIWVGGSDLSYLENGEWESLHVGDSNERDFFASRIAESPDGRILSSWNNHGVYSWAEGHGEWLPDPPNPDQRFRAMNVAPDGCVYLGGDTGEIYCYAEGKWKQLPYPDGQEPSHILSFLFEEGGAVWVGGDSLLFRYQDGASETIPFPYDQKEVSFYEMIRGPDGKIYMATEGVGVAVYDDGEWTFFNKENSGLTTNKTYAIEFDNQGRLWVGTRSNGLYRYQDGGWFHYQRTEGLPPCRISDLAIGQDGRIYLATYDTGFLQFTPETEPPDTQITDHPKEVLLGENMIFRLNGADAWQSTVINRLQFRWRLDDREWGSPDPNRIVSIPTEKPGPHVFEVAAVDLDGNVDPSPDRVSVYVNLPVLRHPATFALLVLLGLAILLVILLLVQRSKRLDQSLKETHDHQSQLEGLVSERTQALKRSEDKYRRLAERLKESNVFKERLIANVSHDFRTPLTSLQGYAQLLASKSPGKLTEEQEEFIQIILDNANRMGLLIQNVAQAVRSEGMDRPLELKPVSLMEVAWNSIRAHSIRAKDQKIDLEMIAEGKEEDLYILASKILVERLLDNLISNGIKFTKPGGKVLVRLDNNDDSVILSVEDSGIGIDESEIPNLFKRFHKAESGEMDHAGGLGLGLSICKEIADLHGAEIEVESVKGKGSTFRVIWPDRGH
ncbi:MAG: hypothetical protein H6752_06140 [Candidatus Omnitrophica bacterium]|nr:hypothetical protein [Candidatus Omnitrophota bacterium]